MNLDDSYFSNGPAWIYKIYISQIYFYKTKADIVESQYVYYNSGKCSLTEYTPESALPTSCRTGWPLIFGTFESHFDDCPTNYEKCPLEPHICVEKCSDCTNKHECLYRTDDCKCDCTYGYYQVYYIREINITGIGYFNKINIYNENKDIIAYREGEFNISIKDFIIYIDEPYIVDIIEIIGISMDFDSILSLKSSKNNNIYYIKPEIYEIYESSTRTDIIHYNRNNIQNNNDLINIITCIKCDILLYIGSNIPRNNSNSCICIDIDSKRDSYNKCTTPLSQFNHPIYKLIDVDNKYIYTKDDIISAPIGSLLEISFSDDVIKSFSKNQCIIYYTIDGSYPRPNDTSVLIYKEPISVLGPLSIVTVSALIYHPQRINSDVIVQKYRGQGQLQPVRLEISLDTENWISSMSGPFDTQIYLRPLHPVTDVSFYYNISEIQNEDKILLIDDYIIIKETSEITFWASKLDIYDSVTVTQIIYINEISNRPIPDILFNNIIYIGGYNKLLNISLIKDNNIDIDIKIVYNNIYILDIGCYKINRENLSTFEEYNDISGDEKIDAMNTSNPCIDGNPVMITGIDSIIIPSNSLSIYDSDTRSPISTVTTVSFYLREVGYLWVEEPVVHRFLLVHDKSPEVDMKCDKMLEWDWSIPDPWEYIEYLRYSCNIFTNNVNNNIYITSLGYTYNDVINSIYNIDIMNNILYNNYIITDNEWISISNILIKNNDIIYDYTSLKQPNIDYYDINCLFPIVCQLDNNNVYLKPGSIFFGFSEQPGRYPSQLKSYQIQSDTNISSGSIPSISFDLIIDIDNNIYNQSIFGYFPYIQQAYNYYIYKKNIYNNISFIYDINSLINVDAKLMLCMKITKLNIIYYDRNTSVKPINNISDTYITDISFDENIINLSLNKEKTDILMDEIKTNVLMDESKTNVLMDETEHYGCNWRAIETEKVDLSIGSLDDDAHVVIRVYVTIQREGLISPLPNAYYILNLNGRTPVSDISLVIKNPSTAILRYESAIENYFDFLSIFISFKVPRNISPDLSPVNKVFIINNPSIDVIQDSFSKKEDILLVETDIYNNCIYPVICQIKSTISETDEHLIITDLFPFETTTTTSYWSLCHWLWYPTLDASPASCSAGPSNVEYQPITPTLTFEIENIYLKNDEFEKTVIIGASNRRLTDSGPEEDVIFMSGGVLPFSCRTSVFGVKLSKNDHTFEIITNEENIVDIDICSNNTIKIPLFDSQTHKVSQIVTSFNNMSINPPGSTINIIRMSAKTSKPTFDYQIPQISSQIPNITVTPVTNDNVTVYITTKVDIPEFDVISYKPSAVSSSWNDFFYVTDDVVPFLKLYETAELTIKNCKYPKVCGKKTDVPFVIQSENNVTVWIQSHQEMFLPSEWISAVVMGGPTTTPTEAPPIVETPKTEENDKAALIEMIIIISGVVLGVISILCCVFILYKLRKSSSKKNIKRKLSAIDNNPDIDNNVYEKNNNIYEKNNNIYEKNNNIYEKDDIFYEKNDIFQKDAIYAQSAASTNISTKNNKKYYNSSDTVNIIDDDNESIASSKYMSHGGGYTDSIASSKYMSHGGGGGSKYSQGGGRVVPSICENETSDSETAQNVTDENYSPLQRKIDDGVPLPSHISQMSIPRSPAYIQRPRANVTMGRVKVKVQNSTIDNNGHLIIPTTPSGGPSGGGVPTTSGGHGVGPGGSRSSSVASPQGSHNVSASSEI
eukprot:GHVL01043798.1.p1 GENE.GHVL01043798.1~~GHVL01043798.1.p1  ORF type:complete len:1778 (-),score=570.77 GHVL01043798.1:369-5504(-)